MNRIKAVISLLFLAGILGKGLEANDGSVENPYFAGISYGTTFVEQKRRSIDTTIPVRDAYVDSLGFVRATKVNGEYRTFATVTIPWVTFGKVNNIKTFSVMDDNVKDEFFLGPTIALNEDGPGLALSFGRALSDKGFFGITGGIVQDSSTEYLPSGLPINFPYYYQYDATSNLRALLSGGSVDQERAVQNSLIRIPLVKRTTRYFFAGVTASFSF